MKFRIMFKDPDGVSECLDDAAKDALPEGLDADEREAVIETRCEKLKKFAERWIEYGEYLCVEFDADAGTAVVVPTNEH